VYVCWRSAWQHPCSVATKEPAEPSLLPEPQNSAPLKARIHSGSTELVPHPRQPWYYTAKESSYPDFLRVSHHQPQISLHVDVCEQLRSQSSLSCPKPLLSYYEADLFQLSRCLWSRFVDREYILPQVFVLGNIGYLT
jgi:hypothetical protein